VKSKDIICFTVVLLTGAFLRFFRLNTQGLFLDETGSWAMARMPIAQMLELSVRDGHPPLYYLLLKAFLAIVPDTEVGLRALSVLSSVAALAILMGVIAHIWGSRAATYSGWLLALSTFDLYYAQETRMYTLLGLLWILSFVLLVEALQGHPRLLIAWGAIAALMPWVQFYGAFALGIEVGFALMLWAWQGLRRQPSPLSSPWLASGALIAIAGAFPILMTLWQQRGFQHNATRLPDVTDLVLLFALVSVGLTAARVQFLDSAHLVLPALSAIQLWSWALLGLLISGAAAVWGLWQSYQSPGVRRWAALLGVLMILVPVLFVFGYSVVFNLRMWALRAFIGVAYMFYFWAGIGLGAIATPWVRRAVAILALVVALASLWPYFTFWRKTDANIAFGALPPTGRHLVVLEPMYLVSVAAYYTNGEADLWGVSTNRQNKVVLIEIPADTPFFDYTRRVTCDTPQLRAAENIWVYGFNDIIRQQWQGWPKCLIAKHLWIFENNVWTPLNQ
jgi:mannosyltransferase